MYYAFGRRSGIRAGAGYGFRGNSPPWPYAGRGRGGLPRCQYPGLSGSASVSGTAALPREAEIKSLKDQVAATKRMLEDLENRLRELSCAPAS